VNFFLILPNGAEPV